MSENKPHGRRILDRRTLLRSGAAAAVAAPLGVFRRAGVSVPRRNAGHRILGISDLQDGVDSAPLTGGATQTETFVERRRGLPRAGAGRDRLRHFQKQNLDIELVNYSGSTDQLLEAIATGKSDAGLGMALRWLKPLEQGFDVKITAGTHGGCMRVLPPTKAASKARRPQGQDRRRRRSGAPDKNFFSIQLAKLGIRSLTRTSNGGLTPATCSSSRSRRARSRPAAPRDPLAASWLKDGQTRKSRPTSTASTATGAAASSACAAA